MFQRKVPFFHCGNQKTTRKSKKEKEKKKNSLNFIINSQENFLRFGFLENYQHLLTIFYFIQFFILFLFCAPMKGLKDILWKQWHGSDLFFYFPQNYYYLDHGIYYKIDDKSIANNGKTNQKKTWKTFVCDFSSD